MQGLAFQLDFLLQLLLKVNYGEAEDLGGASANVPPRLKLRKDFLDLSQISSCKVEGMQLLLVELRLVIRSSSFFCVISLCSFLLGKGIHF